jgi:hypothetical protein
LSILLRKIIILCGKPDVRILQDFIFRAADMKVIIRYTQFALTIPEIFRAIGLHKRHGGGADKQDKQQEPEEVGRRFHGRSPVPDALPAKIPSGPLLPAVSFFALIAPAGATGTSARINNPAKTRP